MNNQVLRRLRVRLPHLQPQYSYSVALRRFYSGQPDILAPEHTAQRPTSTPEPHNDFTSFISKFRTSLPTPPQLQVDQYRVRNLKLVARNLVPEALGAAPHRAYIALAPLPTIPDQPARQTYPVKWLHGETCELLPPMYARLWRVYAAPMKPTPQHLYLGKHMFFASPELAEEFQKHIETLMEKAQHHGHLDRKENQLFYATNTHSARTPVRKGHSNDTPGITALDMRIAIRVEELWDKWLEQGKAKLPPPGTTDSGIEVRDVVGFGISALRNSKNSISPSS